MLSIKLVKRLCYVFVVVGDVYVPIWYGLFDVVVSSVLLFVDSLSIFVSSSVVL